MVGAPAVSDTFVEPTQVQWRVGLVPLDSDLDSLNSTLPSPTVRRPTIQTLKSIRRPPEGNAEA
jgi:hypothetical protein